MLGAWSCAWIQGAAKVSPGSPQISKFGRGLKDLEEVGLERRCDWLSQAA